MRQSSQKVGTFSLNKLFKEWLKLKMLLTKVVLLIWYSEKKIVFGKIKLIFGLENWLWFLKMPNLWRLSPNHLKRYQKILWICSLGCKNLLNFTWNTIKFHNPLHASPSWSIFIVNKLNNLVLYSLCCQYSNRKRNERFSQ